MFLIVQHYTLISISFLTVLYRNKFFGKDLFSDIIFYEQTEIRLTDFFQCAFQLTSNVQIIVK